MKVTFLKLIIPLFFVVNPAFAMMEDEELSKQTSIKRPQQKMFEEEVPPSDIVTIESLPDETLLAVFRFVEIPDLGRLSQVSGRFKRVVEDSALWKYMGARYYGDYLSEEGLREDPEQKVVYHYLSVIMNATANLNEIEQLVSRYRLDLYAPLFKKYISLSFLKSLEKPQEQWDLAIAREHNDLHIEEEKKNDIERKINGHLFGNFGYETNWIKAREFNDLLVEKGNLEAIQRKIRGLIEGKYGYEKNPLAGRELNEHLVKEGDLKAIERKLEGLIFGTFGYEADWIKVREFNELLVDEGDAEAIKRKERGFSFNVTIEEEDKVTSKHRIYSACHREDNSIAQKFNEFFVALGDPVALLRKVRGLKNGTYGYKRDPLAVATVLELLVEKGNPEAIEMKLEGLLRGECGYKKDLVAAREFNEFFAEKGDLKAIERKIKGLLHGCFGYKKKQLVVRELNELLVEKGNLQAIQLKLEGLLKGKYGYEKDLAAARELLHQFLSEEANIKAIERQIEALEKGWDGREKDLEIARELKELLAEKGNPEAIKRKIEGLSEGRYGYEKDPLAARKFNEFLVEQGNLEANQRKIEGLLKGKYGYEKDSTAARELLHQFLSEEANIKAIERQIEVLKQSWDQREQGIARKLNESLVEKGNLEAIERKLIALSAGGVHSLPFRGYSVLTNSVQVPTYGYKRDPLAARELNEFLVERGNPEAIERKVKALLGESIRMYHTGDGSLAVTLTYGYKKDLEAARKFNELLIEEWNIEAIERKIEGLAKGKYGYEKAPSAAREFIESLVVCEFPVARGIGKYLKAFAMKYGISELGYEKDRQKAIEFIKENHVPY